MALITRLTQLFKADFHSVLDHIEEPEQLLRQAIRDMEDDLAGAERRIALCTHDQDMLSARRSELHGTIADIDAELDICFASEKDDLARGLIRKKLEAERLLKHLDSKHAANEKVLEQQRKLLEDNRTTLESMRQKAELLAQRTPARTDSAAELNDIAWMARETTVGDDEIEIAFLREKDRRTAS